LIAGRNGNVARLGKTVAVASNLVAGKQRPVNQLFGPNRRMINPISEIYVNELLGAFEKLGSC
jgi:hypothetical protein